MKCNLCKVGRFKKILTFHDTPIVNNYKKCAFSVIKTDSEILFCENCQSIKNSHDISPNKIFENYSYSSFHTSLLKPIEKFIVEVCNSKNINSILEVGSNNGLFLKNIYNLTNIDNAMGVDPSSPKEDGNDITFISDFFGEKVVKEYELSKKFNLIIARHMFAHVPNPEKIAKELAMCASENSYIYIENADLVNTVNKKDYSQLYLEHFYALSPKSIEKIFFRYGFSIEKVTNFSIHNGSFGVLLKKTKSLNKDKIKQKNYNNTFINEDIKSWLDECRVFFDKFNTKKNYIWGVTAKTVMMLNMLGINTRNGKNIFDGAFDFTKLKIGCYVPGTDIKILDEPKSESNKSLNIMIGARNFSEEIKIKIKNKLPNSNIIVPPF
tara:strand:- start:266 stop:1408 length:1143 start_codon:yes stop_codon:yes gene_type:complete